MQHLSHLLRKVTVTKKLQTTGFVGIMLHIISEHIGEKIEQGHVKHGVLYLHIIDHGKKMLLFREKQKVLMKIHSALTEYGYTIVLKDMRFR